MKLILFSIEEEKKAPLLYANRKDDKDFYFNEIKNPPLHLSKEASRK